MKIKRMNKRVKAPFYLEQSDMEIVNTFAELNSLTCSAALRIIIRNWKKHDMKREEIDVLENDKKVNLTVQEK